MSNITVPNLPAAVALDGTEQLAIVQAGTSRRTTTGQIASISEVGVYFTPLPNAPINPRIGQAYFNTTLGSPYIYLADGWHGFLLDEGV